MVTRIMQSSLGRRNNLPLEKCTSPKIRWTLPCTEFMQPQDNYLRCTVVLRVFISPKNCSKKWDHKRNVPGDLGIHSRTEPLFFLPFLPSFPLPPQFMACVLFSGLANSFEGTPDGGRQEVRSGEVADRVERRIILRAVRLSSTYQICWHLNQTLIVIVMFSAPSAPAPLLTPCLLQSGMPLKLFARPNLAPQINIYCRRLYSMGPPFCHYRAHLRLLILHFMIPLLFISKPEGGNPTGYEMIGRLWAKRIKIHREIIAAQSNLMSCICHWKSYNYLLDRIS